MEADQTGIEKVRFHKYLLKKELRFREVPVVFPPPEVSKAIPPHLPENHRDSSTDTTGILIDQDAGSLPELTRSSRRARGVPFVVLPKTRRTHRRDRRLGRGLPA